MYFTQKRKEYWKYIMQATLVHAVVLVFFFFVMGCASKPTKYCVISEWAMNGSGKLEKVIDRGNKPCEDNELRELP